MAKSPNLEWENPPPPTRKCHQPSFPQGFPKVSPRLGAGRGQLVSGLLPDGCGGGVAAREVLVGEAAVSLGRHRGVRCVEQIRSGRCSICQQHMERDARKTCLPCGM